MLYCLDNARSAAQHDRMAALDEAGICLLCPDGTPPLHNTAHWQVRANDFPYSDSHRHLLLAPHAHVTSPLDLDEEQRADMWTALDWARTEYDFRDYELRARCGDPARTGGTVAHLHMHVIVH